MHTTIKQLTAGLAALGLTLAAGTALAGSCPVQMRAIDAALAAGPALSADTMNEVRSLRAEGERLHKSGKHAQSVETLGEAKKLLGIM